MALRTKRIKKNALEVGCTMEPDAFESRSFLTRTLIPAAGGRLTCKNFSPSRLPLWQSSPFPCHRLKGKSNTKPVLAPASRTVNLTAEQRFILKEIVYKDLKTPKAQAGAPETIGDPVPANVELHDMTPELAEKVPQANEST